MLIDHDITHSKEGGTFELLMQNYPLSELLDLFNKGIMSSNPFGTCTFTIVSLNELSWKMNTMYAGLIPYADNFSSYYIFIQPGCDAKTVMSCSETEIKLWK
jgi:hypothetical protein